MTVSAEDMQRIWEERVRPRLFGSARTCDHPVFLDVGGQPGSGKSRGTEGAAKRLYPDLRFVRIDLDALRKYHPGFDGLAGSSDQSAVVGLTNEFAWGLTDRALTYAREHKISVVYEESFRNSQSVMERLEQFHDAGFDTHVVAMAVPEPVSWQGCVSRYCKAVADGDPARWVDRGFHDEACEGTSRVVVEAESSLAVSRLSVVNRLGEVVSDNVRDGSGAWVRPFDAADAMARQRREPPETVVERFWSDQRDLVGLHDSHGLSDDVGRMIGEVGRDGARVFRRAGSGQTGPGGGPVPDRRFEELLRTSVPGPTGKEPGLRPSAHHEPARTHLDRRPPTIGRGRGR